VYKPGYFNQINLAQDLEPNLSMGLNTQAKQPAQNNIQTNYSIPSSNAQPVINNLPYNQTNVNPAITQMFPTPQIQNQQYSQLPVIPAEPKPQTLVQSKPKAIDDLFDLFDDKNYNQSNKQPAVNVLQPNKLADVFTIKTIDLNQIEVKTQPEPTKIPTPQASPRLDVVPNFNGMIKTDQTPKDNSLNNLFISTNVVSSSQLLHQLNYLYQKLIHHNLR
jgi:hypothetical protein